MPDGYRQEVFNVILAQLLMERGVVTAPERVINNEVLQTRRMPDVIVSFSGLRTAIEGEVNDQQDFHEKAINSVRNRVENGIAHIGIAVVYPTELRSVSFNELKQSLLSCNLEMAIVTETDVTGFVTGNVEYLESILRTSYQQLIQENVVSEAVAWLREGINSYANTVKNQSGTIVRIANILGIMELSE